jgi:hypothetical protein
MPFGNRGNSFADPQNSIARNLSWGVIPSDERSEESRDPYRRQQSHICCPGHPHSDFSQA